MARLKNNSIQGPFLGKVGNLVGCRWKDTYYVRTRPAKVNHPNTEAQMAQRMRFVKTQNYIKPLKEFLRIGYGAFTADKSAYNAAMSFNIKNALTGTYPNIEVNPSLFLVSRGRLPGATRAIVKLVSNDTIKFFWNTADIALPAKPNDKVLLVVRSLDSRDADYKLDAARRIDGGASLVLSPGFMGKQLACYLVFVQQKVLLGNYSEDAISDSIFCGTLNI